MDITDEELLDMIEYNMFIKQSILLVFIDNIDKEVLLDDFKDIYELKEKNISINEDYRLLANIRFNDYNDILDKFKNKIVQLETLLYNRYPLLEGTNKYYISRNKEHIEEYIKLINNKKGLK